MSVDTRAVCVQKEGLWTRGPRITPSFVPPRGFAAASRCELTVLVFQWSRITEEYDRAVERVCSDGTVYVLCVQIVPWNECEQIASAGSALMQARHLGARFNKDEERPRHRASSFEHQHRASCRKDFVACTDYSLQCLLLFDSL